MVVNTACKENTSQYFFITPKVGNKSSESAHVLRSALWPPHGVEYGLLHIRQQKHSQKRN